jgi:hypothetical protein
LRLSIILSFIILSACTNNVVVRNGEQEVFTEEERSKIESTLGTFNTTYEINIDVVVTNSPEKFILKEPSSNKLVRFFISPTHKTAYLSVSKELEEVFPNTMVIKLNKKILNKYFDRSEPVKGIIITTKSLISHLNKKGLLKKRETSQTLGYWIFSGLILLLIILAIVNRISSNRIGNKDIWTDAYQYGD